MARHAGSHHSDLRRRAEVSRRQRALIGPPPAPAQSSSGAQQQSSECRESRLPGMARTPAAAVTASLSLTNPDLQTLAKTRQRTSRSETSHTSFTNAPPHNPTLPASQTGAKRSLRRAARVRPLGFPISARLAASSGVHKPHKPSFAADCRRTSVHGLPTATPGPPAHGSMHCSVLGGSGTVRRGGQTLGRAPFVTPRRCV